MIIAILAVATIVNQVSGSTAGSPSVSDTSTTAAPTTVTMSVFRPATTTRTTGGGTTTGTNSQPTTTIAPPPESIVGGKTISVSPRSGTVACGSDRTIEFTFAVTTLRAGTVQYVLRPDQSMNMAERTGTMTFQSANNDRVKYVVPRTGSPGQRLRGGLIAEIIAPDGDRSTMGDQYDLRCA